MIFLFLLAMFEAYASLNPETLPYDRSHCYSTLPYHHVVVYSAPRTGSSLVYNVCRYLFEEDLSSPHQPFSLGGKVRKTHDRKNVRELGKEGVLYVVPIRHPVDASLSRYRTQNKEVPDVRNWCKRQIAKQAKYLKRIEALRREGYHILLVSYENITNDFTSLFQSLEEELPSLCIAGEDRKRIAQGYSKHNLLTELTSLPDFQHSLPLSGLHGEHIRSDNYSPPPEVRHWLTYFFQKEQKFFQRYGYTEKR